MLTSPPPPKEFGRLDLSRIAQDLQIRKVQVESVVQLLDEGNTIPFITRYRKERTGGLDEEVLRTIQDRVGLLRQLADRKQTVLRSIENQGKLTEELRGAIIAAENPKRLEDLYLPFKPKKRSLATAAREKGLEPLALAVWNSDPAVANLTEVLTGMINPEKELNTPEDVLNGVQHIVAEMISESSDIRGMLRNVLWDTGVLTTSKSEKLTEGQGAEYKDYFEFKEPIKHIPPHRVLAINRGEKENALHIKLEWDSATGHAIALERLPLPLPGESPTLPLPPPREAETPPPSLETAPTQSGDAAPAETPPTETAPVAEAPPPEPMAPPPPRHLSALWDARTEALRVHPHADFLKKTTTDALNRLLVPSLEREIRRELTQRSEGHAVEVFARNLRGKLLAPPLRGRRVLAVDPGFRTGCKLAVLDETGNLLEDGVIYPHTPPQTRRAEARVRLEELVRKHQLQVIAIGNGTACRETEEVVSELIADLDDRRHGRTPAVVAPESAPEPEPVPAPPEALAPPAPSPEAAASTPEGGETPPQTEAVPAPSTDGSAPIAPPEPPPPPPPNPLLGLPDAPPELAYVIVNEAGASVYSASPVGREEFPNFDATLRGTISIGRRLQDPLSELVKIDPQHVGVGLYQHDVSPKQLRESLDGVVESCVNSVGVDLNTASVPLLRHVSGLNQMVARDLVEYRKANGPFQNREQLMQVNGIGEGRFVQAAGFLKIGGGADPLDGTWIHPESYPVARQILTDLGFTSEDLLDKQRLEELREKLNAVSLEETAERLQIGVPTLDDIFRALARPGRDPREDLPPPIFKKGVLKLEDLEPNMELKGTVLNVVDFGAFIDIGLKDSGLVHISQMANRYVKSPYDVAAVGDVVTAWVLAVDKERRRVSLTMIQPGTERKPPEKKPMPPRREGPPRAERRPPQENRAPQDAGRQPQGGGGRPQQGGRPPHGGDRSQQGGGGRGLPPRGVRRPTAGQQQGGRGQGSQGGGSGTDTVQQPAAAPRPPRRPTPKPNLSQAALAGAAPLGTFAELAAFWDAKKQEDAPAAAPTAPPAGEEGQAPPT